MTIEETIKSLSQTYNIKTEKDETLHSPLAYLFTEDTILYNPALINRCYELFSKFVRINITDLITHIFGHELAHRKKYKTYGIERAKVIEDVLMFFFREPTVAIDILPQNEKHLFATYRATSIAYMLFEEHYAVKENSLYNPTIHKAEIAYTVTILKRRLDEVRKLMHSLILFAPEMIEGYFIDPLVCLPLKYFKLFYQEYPTIRKIKFYLENEITTPNDVFDTDKMEELANILLYEL